jgi:hypothetical protein
LEKVPSKKVKNIKRAADIPAALLYGRVDLVFGDMDNQRALVSVIAGIVEGGVISNGSEEERGTGALLNSLRFAALALDTSAIFTRTRGSEPLDPSVRFRTSRTSSATNPRFAPCRLPFSGL